MCKYLPEYGAHIKYIQIREGVFGLRIFLDVGNKSTIEKIKKERLHGRQILC
jgi:hypothetical protein